MMWSSFFLVGENVAILALSADVMRSLHDNTYRYTNHGLIVCYEQNTQPLGCAAMSQLCYPLHSPLHSLIISLYYYQNRLVLLIRNSLRNVLYLLDLYLSHRNYAAYFNKYISSPSLQHRILSKLTRRLAEVSIGSFY